jgi:hypothetical protein
MYIRALRNFSANVPSGSENKIEEFHIVDIKDDILNLIFKEYDEDRKQGGDYLEPKKVTERLGLSSKNVDKAVSKSQNSVNKNNSFLGRSESLVSGAKKYSNKPKCILRDSADGRDEFLVGKRLKVFIYQENIIDLKNINVLVCPEGRSGTCQGYLAQQIMANIPKEQQRAITSLLQNPPRHISNILQSYFGVLNYGTIFFAIIRKFPNHEPREEDLDQLWYTTLNVLKKADIKGSKNRKGDPVSVAMPLLGTGKPTKTKHLYL